MQNLDFQARHLDLLLQMLNHYAPEAEVWAYGSRVAGSAHESSDIDLVLRNPSRLNQPMPQLPRLRDALTESNLPMMVDLLDWARLPENFRRQIEKLHVVLRLPTAATDTVPQGKA